MLEGLGAVDSVEPEAFTDYDFANWISRNGLRKVAGNSTTLLDKMIRFSFLFAQFVVERAELCI